MFEHALVMARIEADNSHEAFVEVEACSIVELQVKAFDHFGKHLITGAVLDVERHVERIVKNVLQAQAQALLRGGRRFQRRQVGGELGYPVAAQGTGSPQAAEYIERITDTGLPQHDVDLSSVGHKGLAFAGKALVAPINGILLVEALFFVFIDEEVFAAVKCSGYPDPSFEFVVFEKVL